MRTAAALLALTLVACSKSATGASNDTGVVIVITTGTVYAGHPWTATVTNNSTSTVNVRALDCGTQVEKLNGSAWTSYVPTGSICNFYGITAGASQLFTINFPASGGAGTYRVVSAVQAAGDGETAIYSDNFTTQVAPPCTVLTPPGTICTPQ